MGTRLPPRSRAKRSTDTHQLASVPDDAMARIADADRVVGVGEGLVVATGPFGEAPKPIHRAAGLGDARRDLRLDVCGEAARYRRRRREKVAGSAGQLAEAQSRRWREVKAEVLTPPWLTARVPDLVLAAGTVQVARQ